MTNNTISNSVDIGLYLENYYNGHASVYNNNFINNSFQIHNDGSSSFNYAAPVGGNYISDFNTPAQGCNNANSDTFCDAAYVFSGGQDNLPWTTQNAWVASVNQAPTASAGGPYNGSEGTAIAMSASASDPNPDTLAYSWSVNSALCSFDNASALNPSLTCTDNGSFIATLTVGDGVNPAVSSAASVTVANVAPSGSFSISGPIFEGGSAMVSFIGASDPSSNETAAGFHYAFDCNGGSLAAATYAASGTSSTKNCGYADSGSFIIHVKIMDKDDGSNEYTAPVTVNNGDPVLGVITVVNPLVPVNTVINASASFTDVGSLDSHTAVWNWDDGTTSAGTISPATGNGTTSASHSYALPGVYVPKLTVTDTDGASSSQVIYEFVVVYDPTAGYATGSGSITSPGAYRANPTATYTGKLGFNTRYKKDGTLESETEFELSGVKFHFHSYNAQWLVVNSPKAEYQGTGSVEGSNHQFGYTLTIIDGQSTVGGGVDKTRLRIWDIDNGSAIVYDTQAGASVYDAPTTQLAKGDVKIKK